MNNSGLLMFKAKLQIAGFDSIDSFDQLCDNFTYVDMSKLLGEKGISIPPVVIEKLLNEYAEERGEIALFIRKSLYRHIIRSLDDPNNKGMSWIFKMTNAVAACTSRLPLNYSNMCISVWEKLKLEIDEPWRPNSWEDQVLREATR